MDCSFTSTTPSAPNRPRIQVAATDEDVVQRIAALWACRTGVHQSPGIRPGSRTIGSNSAVAELSTQCVNCDAHGYPPAAADPSCAGGLVATRYVVPPRIAQEPRRVRAARSARHPVKVQVTGSNPVRGAASALLELRSARHPLKVETAGSNPAQRIPCHRGREVAGTCLPSRRRGFESLRWLQDRSPSLPFPEVVRLVEDTVSKTAGGRKASRGFESLRLRRMTLGVIGTPPDSGSGNRGSSPRSGAACARGGTGRRAALRALWPQARGGSSPSGRTQVEQAAQHHAAVVHQGERQLAKLEAAGSSPADRTIPA
jgi:hypothetical protein